MHLANLNPRLPLAPSIDIDEMWHIHMLNPRTYFADCIKNFGYIIDHTGSFGFQPENRPLWLQIYKDTQLAWQKMYKEEMAPPKEYEGVHKLFSVSTSHGHGFRPPVG